MSEASQADSGPTTGSINPETHITLLTVLNFLGAGVLAFGGVVVYWGTRFAGRQGSFWSGLDWVELTMAEIGLFILLICLAMAVPLLIAGIGLAQRQEWGRMLTLVAAGIVGLGALTSFTFVPLAYSIYAFWALTHPEVAGVFQRGGANTGGSQG